MPKKSRSKQLTPHQEGHAAVAIIIILAALIAALSILGYIGYG